MPITRISVVVGAPGRCKLASPTRIKGRPRTADRRPTTFAVKAVRRPRKTNKATAQMTASTNNIVRRGKGVVKIPSVADVIKRITNATQRCGRSRPKVDLGTFRKRLFGLLTSALANGKSENSIAAENTNPPANKRVLTEKRLLPAANSLKIEYSLYREVDP